MITINDVRIKTMSNEKKAEAKNSYFAFYVGRPISYLLTIPFLYTSITPNIITIISIVFSTIGFMLLGFGSSLSHRLIGLLFFFLWNIFDGIDGNIARYKNVKTISGDTLDTFGGYYSMCLMLFGLGVSSFNDFEDIVIINNVFPLVLSGLSCVFALIPRLLMHRQNEKMLKNNVQKESSLNKKESYNFIKIFALNISDPAGFQEIIFLISILFHISSIVSIFYFMFNSMIMIYSINSLIKE